MRKGILELFKEAAKIEEYLKVNEQEELLRAEYDGMIKAVKILGEYQLYTDYVAYLKERAIIL